MIVYHSFPNVKVKIHTLKSDIYTIFIQVIFTYCGIGQTPLEQTHQTEAVWNAKFVLHYYT